MVNDDTVHQLNEALGLVAEAQEIEGVWTLDRFIRRHARNRGPELESTARQIDELETRKRRYASQMESWSGLTFLSGFVALAALLRSSLWLFGEACTVVAVGIVARHVARRSWLRTSDGINLLNHMHFEPLGVFYGSERSMVQRSSSAAKGHVRPR